MGGRDWIHGPGLPGNCPVFTSESLTRIEELAAELNELAEKTRERRISPADMEGGTFTISNVSMLGMDGFTPVLNPPETGILGVGRVIEKPAVFNGEIAIRQMMMLSLTYDHRLIDGAPAARFLQRVKQLVERPFALVLGG